MDKHIETHMEVRIKKCAYMDNYQDLPSRLLVKGVV